MYCVVFFQAEDGIRDAQESRGIGDVYKRQVKDSAVTMVQPLCASAGTSARSGATPVSYTHLTLPTIYSVYISVVAVTLKKKKNKQYLGVTRYPYLLCISAASTGVQLLSRRARLTY